MKLPSVRLALAAAALALLPGCAVVNLAASAAGAAIDVGGAVVSTTVRVGGKVVEKVIDAASADAAAP